jgi:hypothetical protein
MKVNIVCYEDLDAWILGKFARKMHENLLILGIESKISKVSDPSVDINHHIIYVNYNKIPSSIDTLMITHIDDSWKLNLIKKQLEVSLMGICMSKETMLKLIAFGIPEDRLSYVNPAHDGIIKPRKIVVGITCMVQNDGRKREIFLDKLAKIIDPDIFMFKIMGRNWDPQVRSLKSAGFDVEYDSEFNYDKYVQMIPSLDYYLYMGQDEGQMGFVDALSAGVKTITTPQGYHLDAPGGIIHSFNTYGELVKIFKNIELEKKNLINSVISWNWLDYTKKHVEIWNYLISKKNNQNFKYPEKTNYTDGIFSTFQSEENEISQFDTKKELKKLRQEYYRHIYYKIKDKLTIKFLI